MLTDGQWTTREHDAVMPWRHKVEYHRGRSILIARRLHLVTRYAAVTCSNGNTVPITLTSLASSDAL